MDRNRLEGVQFGFRPLIPERNVVFFGETGMGKSSAINLLLETGTSAQVSNDSHPCTQVSTGYKTILNGARYILWDTRGLGEASGFFQKIFKLEGGPEKELRKFLKERYQKHEIDLLVYCVRGSRAIKASVKYYNKFCVITRLLAAPVVILVTEWEKESNSMDDWWRRNSSHLAEMKMEFDDHACITTLPGDSRTAESKQSLVDMITKERRWRACRSGNYFGSLVQTPIPPAETHNGLIRSLFRKKYETRTADSPDDSMPSSPVVEPPTPSSATMESVNLSLVDADRLRVDLQSQSKYETCTADSPDDSVPSTGPVAEPPTPSSATTESVNPFQNGTDHLRVDLQSQSSSERSFGAGNSLYSLVRSSNTSHTEVSLHTCTPENEVDYLGELPLRRSGATVVRTKHYATRSGAFGDIWECKLIRGESSCMVAVKVVKLSSNSNGDLKSVEKKLRRELKIWGSLQHRHIVPLLGTVFDFGPLSSMVSPWFKNGSLSCYLEQQRSASDKDQLLGDIAAGLSYLHSHDVTHGDLHSDNVLIDDEGRACLTDFGLSFVSDFVGTSYLKSSICGALQFADPALVQQVSHNLYEIIYPTKRCDVYSFGGLMLHILFDKKPYDGLSALDIWSKILDGKRPDIPIYDGHVIPYRSLIQKCWDEDEHKRPSADGLVAAFAQKL